MRGRLGTVSFGAILLGAACAARAETLPEGWAWRRPVSFKVAASDAPGENLAWVDFYTNGAQKGDGSDIRVTTADRTLVAHKLLQVTEGSDLVRVVFETKTEGPYYVWWGNPKAEKPAREAEIKRGIYLEVSRNNGPAGGGGAAALNAATGPVLASYFLPELALGYNPFGDERQAVMHYQGAFKIDREIKAQIAFTVNDLGVLLIDGKEVDREVRVGLKSQVRNSVPVDLAAGWHTLEIKQVNQNAANIVMALAWQRPGEKVFTPMPGSIFAPAARASAGIIEKVGGGAYAADIAVEPTAEGFIPPGSYAQRYTFEALFPPTMKPAITWDFGDGQTLATLKKPSHIFLGPGVYPVTVKLEFGNNITTTTTRVQVKDRMYERFPRPPEDPPAALRTVLHDYQPEKLPVEQAFRGMQFFESGNGFGDMDYQLVWGKAWLEGKDHVPPPDNVVFDEAFDLSRIFISRKDFKQAAETYKLAAAKQIGMETRVNLMRHEVMTLCDYVEDADAALAEARDWVKRISVSNRMQVQTAQTALAYALIAKQDGKGAKAAVDAAVAARGSAAAGGGDAFNRRQIRQGVLTRNVENDLQTKDYDDALTLLNQWELEFPEALWEGFTRTLRVKLAAAEGRNLVAAHIALAHARANPEGFYAAELLYRAAENFKLGGEGQQAQTTMDLLKTKYPESPYARDAGK